MTIMLNTSSINDKIFFWKRNKSNSYGQVPRPIPYDELVIKRTKEALFVDGALGLLAACCVYFKIKGICVQLNARDRAIARYSYIRLGKSPKILNPFRRVAKYKEKMALKRKEQEAAEAAKKAAEEEAQKAAEEAKNTAVKDAEQVAFEFTDGTVSETTENMFTEFTDEATFVTEEAEKTIDIKKFI